MENPIVELELVRSGDFPTWLDEQDEAVRRWVAAHGFCGKPTQALALPSASGELCKIAVGLGDAPGFYSLAHLPAAFPGLKLALPEAVPGERSLLEAGFLLGRYRFDRYKAPAQPAPAELTAVSDEAQSVARAVITVRDLVNTPAEDMGPQQLEDFARELAQRCGAQLRVTSGEDLARDYPAIHAVGRAAEQRPRLIELEWGQESDPRVALVGKGVCFDSGGLDIKPGKGMLLMKKDMGGAAHALALAQWIMESGLKLRLHVLVPAVENAISGNAYRPGDVVHTRSGRTIEIGNTDAEGRVILADALTRACEDAPEMMLDFATLTGAARVALGPDLPPVFTDDEELARGLLSASEQVQDPLWRMPLFAGYEEDINSPIADVQNVGKGPMAGAITAALFLKRFVDPDVPWAHLDVYAWNPSDRPGRPRGGEAHGLRAAYAYLAQRYG